VFYETALCLWCNSAKGVLAVFLALSCCLCGTRDGLKKMSQFTPPILLTDDEWDFITYNKSLCTAGQEIDLVRWSSIMSEQVTCYCLRNLSVSIPAVLKEDQHLGTMMLGVRCVVVRDIARTPNEHTFAVRCMRVHAWDCAHVCACDARVRLVLAPRNEKGMHRQAATDKTEMHAVPGRLILEKMPDTTPTDKSGLVRAVPKHLQHLQALKRNNSYAQEAGSVVRKNVNAQDTKDGFSSWQSEGRAESPLGSPLHRDPWQPSSARRAAPLAGDADQKKQAEALLALQQGQETILAALKDMTSSLRALEDRVAAGEGVGDGQGAWESRGRARAGESSGGEYDSEQLRERGDSGSGGQDGQALGSSQLEALAYVEQAWDKAANLESDPLSARRGSAKAPVRA